ncbi:MAG: hypothetical protein ACQERX_03830 [Bacillota bacterium]
MSKKAKIIILLMLALSILALYMILTLQEVTVKPNSVQNSEDYNQKVQEKIEQVEEEYKIALNDIFRDYDNLMMSRELDDSEKVEGIIKLRDELMNLNVPAQYKALHFDLFKAFSNFNEQGIDDLSQAVSEIDDLIFKAREAYNWLSS